MLTNEEKIRRYDEQMKAREEYNKKRRVKIQLILAKATKANIKVSDKEVEDEMKRSEGLKR